MNEPKPLDLSVQFDLSLDTIVGMDHRQTGEDDYATEMVTVLDLIVRATGADLAKRLYQNEASSLRGLVKAQVEAAISARLEPILTATLEGQIQETNTWGEATGKTMTLREIVIERALSELTRRPTDRYNDKKESILNTALREITDATIRKELAEDLAAAKATVRAQLTDVVTKAIGEVVK